MHQTRAAINKRIPVPRKGTRYLVRTKDHPAISVSVLIATRDMLHLTKTLRETKYLIHTKKLKINGRLVRDYRQPIRLLSLFETDKKYKLTLLPTGKFSLEESNDSTRIAKVIGKRLVRGNKVQVSLHEGTSVLTTKEITVGDSVVLTQDNEIKEIKPLKKGSKVMIISGKSSGSHGVVSHVENGAVTISIGGRDVTLNGEHVIVL